VNDIEESISASEVILFARVLDESTRAGMNEEQLLPVLDLFCAVARSDSGDLEVGANGRSLRCTVGSATPTTAEFELRGDGGLIGRICVAPPTRGTPWTHDEFALLTLLSTLMAERFERTLAAESSRLAVVQLSAALESRILLEQAKGMLAERHGDDLEEAFARLRIAARQQRRTLREVAEEVVLRRPPPDSSS
jgi:hypothetical protein